MMHFHIWGILAHMKANHSAGTNGKLKLHLLCTNALSACTAGPAGQYLHQAHQNVKIYYFTKLAITCKHLCEREKLLLLQLMSHTVELDPHATACRLHIVC